jgi:hypothetical protein
VKLLNLFYDDCDWQDNSVFNPIIAQCEEAFTINYLIEKDGIGKETLVLCVKAPCFNSKYS